MKKSLFLAFFFAIISFKFSLAGEIKSIKDDFEETSTVAYVSTSEEVSSSGIFYSISHYDNSSEQVVFMVIPEKGATDCSQRSLKIKLNNGSIKEVSTIEKHAGNNFACFSVLPAKYVEKPFKVKIPMYTSASDITADINTRSLRLSQISID